MNKRRLVLFLSLCPITFAFVSNIEAAAKTPDLPPQYSTNVQSFAAINALSVSGNVEVILKPTTDAQTSVQILRKGKYQSVSIRPGDHTLKISGGGLAGGSLGSNNLAPQVQVSLPQLNQLKVSGHAVVTGSDVKIHLQQLIALGNGQVHIHWINSPSLSIVGKQQSLVELAGTTNNLYVKLKGNARFMGRYLRANDVMVSTQDSGIAETLPIMAMHSFAYKNSVVNYYKYPQSRNNYSQDQANVLQLGWQR